MLLGLSNKRVALGTLLASAAAASVAAFQPAKQAQRAGVALNMVAIDPSTVTKKDYEDICGVSFDEQNMKDRLRSTKYLYPKHVEVIEDIAPIADEMVDAVLLETGDASWQPQDFLPDLTKEGWEDEVKELREMASGLSDDVLVVLIGDLITEEALPTYQTLLNTFEGCDDPTGTTDTPWARWSRGWTSEENRHGDLLNKYLYLTGRTDMRSIEVTIQHLITNGFNPGAQKDPYRGFVYTSFQERATKVSHANVGKLARREGDTRLSKICNKIAGDEGRHEKAYQTFSEEILARDADGLLMVFGDMMRGQITMPAENMCDGVNDHLYNDFSTIAQRIGVYTAIDYAEIIEHLVKRWDLEKIEGLSSAAEKERDYLCRLPERYRKLAERSMNKAAKAGVEQEKKPFAWLHGRAV
ncbi:Palmitoyl-[acyl-carrier-protein] 4-desaturase 3, chloroplastic [Seminavis robusta]|uniref:Palmitoyl-[acyl-carrier-protein] 4-desaturase 3, chloroplastic n=1 Tax=Seminavis robusta TaxID=568900 RepID=A0A9N8DT01_9STRA|nr:Palmitoyl-[acyl-carrier-protein] 4-desaturase 3, chloroplastic [Seminavis robusta]|eukprot:Sro229_g093150.1 Palmitoyl-[acyl-carrier-protein] 4-desaturase 3, chloroplastic (413) ;mRNA; r:75431-76798